MVIAYHPDGTPDPASGFALDPDNKDPNGITFGEGKLWIVDRLDDRVYAYDLDGIYDPTYGFTLSPSNEEPTGITFGEGKLWIVDRLDDRVYAYDLDGTLDPASGFALYYDNRYPDGIVFGEGKLWIVDRLDDRVYVYTTDGTYDYSSGFSLDPDNREPSGMEFMSDKIWTVDRWNSTVYSYTLHPVLASAVTGPNEITLMFSEPVTYDNVNPLSDVFSNIVLFPGGDRVLESVAGMGSNTITITFGGDPVGTDATAMIEISNMTDLSGSELDLNHFVVFASDAQEPILFNVSIISDNADSEMAEIYNTVTLVFVASEPLDGVVVTIDGNPEDVTSDDSVIWTATKTITSMDVDGAEVTFTIDYMDMASISGEQITKTTDDSSVTISNDPSNTATVTGTLFADANRDGIQNNGETGFSGYTMTLIDTIGNIRTTDTDSNGSYMFESVKANTEFLIQTGFFPTGHIVEDLETSWFTYVNLSPGNTKTFDVGFYPVSQSERTTLNLTIYHDVNANGMRDAGEPGIGDRDLIIHTYITGPEIVTTGSNGTLVKDNLMPATWVIASLPQDYIPTAYSYERSDSTKDKYYNPASPAVFDPEPGSIHTIIIGMIPG